MASSKEFVEYAAAHLSEAGCITCRKMFGEYGVYCDGIFFALICDNQLFLKITPEGRQCCPSLPEAPPYAGAKPYFLIENLEDRAALIRLTAVTCQAISASPKKKRSH